MPYSGYQQDLSQLVPECLLSISEPALTDHSRQTSDLVELTPSTFALLRELDCSRDSALQHQTKQKSLSTSTERGLSVEHLLYFDKNCRDIVEASDPTLITLSLHSVSSSTTNDILQHRIETIPKNRLLYFENINRTDNTAENHTLPNLSPINLTQTAPPQLIPVSNWHNFPSNAHGENEEQKALVTSFEKPTFAECLIQVDFTTNNISNAPSGGHLQNDHKNDNTTTNHLLDVGEADPLINKITGPAPIVLSPNINWYKNSSKLQKFHFEEHKAEDKAVHDEFDITFDVTPTRNQESTQGSTPLACILANHPKPLIEELHANNKAVLTEYLFTFSGSDNNKKNIPPTLHSLQPPTLVSNNNTYLNDLLDLRITSTSPVELLRVVETAAMSDTYKELLNAQPSTTAIAAPITEDGIGICTATSSPVKLPHAVEPTTIPSVHEEPLNAQFSKTTLAARTTEGVIADLTRKRTSNISQHRDERLGSTSNEQFNQYSIKLPSNLSEIHLTGYKKVKLSNNSDHEDEDEDDEDDEESAPAPSKKKLTARKMRINATVDRHMQDRNQRLLKEGVKVKPEDQTHQSTRWLVNQSENHRIISSPREYQVELFEKAKDKNIIAVLDTGSGKTLIAVLLLRHIFAQELEDRALGKPKRISFFLVDSVQLVFQQHAVLKANLDQPMDMFCGDMGCDLWSRSLWEKHFAKNMVIVCTSEVLRQCLHHSFISIDRINLLIFDEAHHAKKDHSYARIIKDFYVPQENRINLPKIFGMTASPVDARVDVRKAAAELEAILHCEIATAADSSLLQHTIATKQEQLAKYSQLGSEVKTELYSKMYENLRSNIVMKKPLLFALEASKELGTWCSDQVWPSCLTEEETKKLMAKTERRYLAKKVQDPMEVLEKHKAQLQEAQDILRKHIFEAPDFNPPQGSFDFEAYRSSNLSTKVVVLIQFLKERFERPTEDKCIIFVRRRYTAQLLVKLFSQPNIGTPNLFVGALVGTRSGDAGDLNVSFREQVLTMMNFRKSSTEEGGKVKGFINCLFATSVAEEGLDIPDCNLVIRFDLYTTLIQYIQSRGRARHANSRYIHMYEDGNQDHLMIIKEVRQNEGILKRFCSALPEDRKLTGNDFDMDHFLSKEKTHRVYKTSTGAKLNYKMSLMVLANFIDSLPRGPDINLQAEYIMTVHNKMFICEVILPEAAPIRGAVGRPATTKQVAKCSAAFETCLELVKGKYLDEWLLPIFTKQLPAMRNAHLAVDSKKREAYDMKTKPKLWSMTGVPVELYVTVLKLDSTDALDRPSQPLALLTRARLPQLPSFFLHFGGGRHSSVQCMSLTSSVRVDNTQIGQINNFTIKVFDDVFSKLYESDIPKMPYFLAPVNNENITADTNPDTVISWGILKSVQDYADKWGENVWDDLSWKTETDDFFKDKYVIDPYDGSRKMWTVGVTPEYKPLDPVPPNTAVRSGTRKNNDNIQEYSCSLWAKARAKRVFDTTQRVIECRLVSLRRNLLDELDAPENEGPKKLYVILEPLRISPLPTTVVAMAYIFPAIIHRLESYLISMEACELLHLQIRPDLALEACTKDSDNSEDHGTEQINFQHGMGNNYERLEFLGDCFLKMATSISLYGLHPDNDEYSYHVDRMLMICNKNLKDNAMKLKLYEYIRSMSFNRRAWYPEGLVLKKGKTATAPNSHKLGDKSIADVCEAMIGAALLTFHESRNMDNAVRAVTELVCSENHQVTCFADYYKLYKKPKYQLAAATEMQKNLAMQVEQKHGYHFRYPRLLRSAFIHPSYPFSYEHVPSYQRLEFLGDSLLDMACVNFLFHNHPNKDPQWLTEHKMAMASNQFLGCLCVSLGFHTHLLVFNSAFQKQIADYVTDITEARRAAIEDAIRAGKNADNCAPDFWMHVRQPPKCLPDIIEAYIGAIFVDSEYNYVEVERFFDTHIKWYFQDMSIYDTYANKHPTTFLTNFLQVNMGCMEWVLTHRELPGIDGAKSMVVAMVIVHDQVVADWQAESSRYAKVAAAKKAMDILRGLPLPEFREKYCCSCRPEEVEEGLAAEGVVDDVQ